MSSREAQILANKQGVDLVEIAANANPPVVKLIDFFSEANRVKIWCIGFLEGSEEYFNIV